jgi:Na+/H+ antiporter NhaC
LVGFANLAIANNTVSIVITGPIAKEINDEYDLNPKKDSRYFRYLFLYCSRNFALWSTGFINFKLCQW